MSELELELMQKGYPLIDQESEGDCCMGESDEWFRCSWKIQRVELPESSGMEGEADGGSVDSESTGALGALMDIQEKGPAALGEGAGHHGARREPRFGVHGRGRARLHGDGLRLPEPQAHARGEHSQDRRHGELERRREGADVSSSPSS